MDAPESLIPQPHECDDETDCDHTQSNVEDHVSGGGRAVHTVFAVQLVDLRKQIVICFNRF